MILHLNKLESLHSRILCANLVVNGPVVLEKESKMGKSLRTDDGRTTGAWAFSSGELKTTKSTEKEIGLWLRWAKTKH